MKYLILSLLFFQLSYSQNYSFDNLFEYKTDTNQTIFFMTNENNHDFLFYGFSKNDIKEGYIVDYTTNVFHNFDYENEMNTLDFKYLNSRKSKVSIKNYRKDVKVHYQYQSNQIDSLHNEMTINFIKKNQTQLDKKAKIIYIDDDRFVLHPNHIEFYAHNFFNAKEKLKLDMKLPSRMVFQYSKNSELRSDLVQQKKINVLLIISNTELTYRQ